MTSGYDACWACNSNRAPTGVSHCRSYSPLREAGCNKPRRISLHQPTPTNVRQSPSTVQRASWRPLPSLIHFLLLSILLCSQVVHARNASYRFQGHTELLFDKSQPPVPQMDLLRRSIDSGSLTHHSQSPSSLPRPFDSNLGNNFTTSSCPAFFKTFLSDPLFQKCLPLSLLLQTSNAFFAETRFRKQLTQTLDATCNVDSQHCSSLMASYAQQIQSHANCGADLHLQNPMVEQAYNGFIAYQPLYHAGCLKNTDGSYCFVDAVTNLSAPTSSYIYYLPLGMSLPTITEPTCNKCLRDTMGVFAVYARDSLQPLNTDYAAAATLVDGQCGSGYVISSVQTTSGSATLAPSAWLSLLTLLFVFSRLLF